MPQGNGIMRSPKASLYATAYFHISDAPLLKQTSPVTAFTNCKHITFGLLERRRELHPPSPGIPMAADSLRVSRHLLDIRNSNRFVSCIC
jgi:hypothetical protein